MPLHGTCFIGAGAAWSSIAIFAQQSPVAVFAAPIEAGAMKHAGVYRLNRSPNEKGKAGQDNEQSPEDQDPHVCNIRRSLPPFNVPSAAATGLLLSAIYRRRKGPPHFACSTIRKFLECSETADGVTRESEGGISRLHPRGAAAELGQAYEPEVPV
jgi:hypothetical protein